MSRKPPYSFRNNFPPPFNKLKTDSHDFHPPFNNTNVGASLVSSLDDNKLSKNFSQIDSQYRFTNNFENSNASHSQSHGSPHVNPNTSTDTRIESNFRRIEFGSPHISPNTRIDSNLNFNTRTEFNVNLNTRIKSNTFSPNPAKQDPESSVQNYNTQFIPRHPSNNSQSTHLHTDVRNVQNLQQFPPSSPAHSTHTDRFKSPIMNPQSPLPVGHFPVPQRPINNNINHPQANVFNTSGNQQLPANHNISPVRNFSSAQSPINSDLNPPQANAFNMSGNQRVLTTSNTNPRSSLVRNISPTQSPINTGLNPPQANVFNMSGNQQVLTTSNTNPQSPLVRNFSPVQSPINSGLSPPQANVFNMSGNQRVLTTSNTNPQTPFVRNFSPAQSPINSGLNPSQANAFNMSGNQQVLTTSNTNSRSHLRNFSPAQSPINNNSLLNLPQANVFNMSGNQQFPTPPNISPQPPLPIMKLSPAQSPRSNNTNLPQVNALNNSGNQHSPSISNSTFRGHTNLPIPSNNEAQINNIYQRQNIHVGNPMSITSKSTNNLQNVAEHTNRVQIPENNCSKNPNHFVNMSTDAHYSAPTLESHNPPMQHNKSISKLPAPPMLPVLVMAHVPPPSVQYSAPLHLPPPPMPKNEISVFMPFPNVPQTFSCDKVSKLTEFLKKFSIDYKKVKEKSLLTIPEFRSALIAGVSLTKELQQRKFNLTNLLESDENKWNAEMKNIFTLKGKLSKICSFISDPHRLKCIVKKIQVIKKKREQKKKTKLNKLSEKIKKEMRRKELNQDIDKWLDDIKEKNLKQKREAEMKKEADYILLEVRKKIHEANRTIEKIKVFEKLRNVREANAAQKGLHLTPEHNENFERKVSILKSTMLKQLADYEAEQKALEVMLETEQEGQLKEEIQWKIKKVKAFQHKRQKHIIECLFGNSENPVPTDPLFLFHKFQTSANNSIENLVQIRSQWDMHIVEDGETVPQQWIVPSPTNYPDWEKYLTTASGATKN